MFLYEFARSVEYRVGQRGYTSCCYTDECQLSQLKSQSQLADFPVVHRN